MRHTVWRVDEAAAVAAISAAVAEQPVVVADGHHRYETSLTYQAEREAADGDAGAAGATLAYLVELVEDELTVHAIHRLALRPARGPRLLAALRPGSRTQGHRPPTDRSPTRWPTRDASPSCSPTARCSSDPEPDALADARDLDSSRLDVALAALPDHELRFQHGVDQCGRRWPAATRRRACCSAPSPWPQIEATAHGASACPPPRRRTPTAVRTLVDAVLEADLVGGERGEGDVEPARVEVAGVGQCVRPRPEQHLPLGEHEGEASRVGHGRW